MQCCFQTNNLKINAARSRMNVRCIEFQTNTSFVNSQYNYHITPKKQYYYVGMTILRVYCSV